MAFGCTSSADRSPTAMPMTSQAALPARRHAPPDEVRHTTSKYSCAGASRSGRRSTLFDVLDKPASSPCGRAYQLMASLGSLSQ